MKTTRDERIARIVLGLGVMFVGSFSFYHVIIAGYLFGLLLIGIGLYPKSTEYPEDAAHIAKSESVPAAKASAPKKAMRKKPARKN